MKEFIYEHGKKKKKKNLQIVAPKKRKYHFRHFTSRGRFSVLFMFFLYIDRGEMVWMSSNVVGRRSTPPRLLHRIANGVIS
jgi:hypothetical protein